MFKVLLLTVLLTVTLSRTYPMFKQCDGPWGNEELGHSGQTVCKIGCMMTSLAMALNGTGNGYNPGSLNKWLTANGGYDGSGVNPWKIGDLGLPFENKCPNSEIKAKLDAGKVVVVNVNDGRHWVLAYGYNGDTILVNDPYFSTGSYPLSQIVNGNTHVWGVKKASFNFIGRLTSLKQF